MSGLQLFELGEAGHWTRTGYLYCVSAGGAAGGCEVPDQVCKGVSYENGKDSPEA